MLGSALRWRHRALVGLAIAVLWLFSMPVVADAVMRSLEDRYAYRSNAGDPEADAVYALGGGVLGPRDGQDDQVEWGPCADRLNRALSLYSSNRARLLVLSAGGLSDSGELRQGVRFRDIALQRGVPPESIIVTRETPNTAAEADAIAELATRLRWKRILLVTSAYHMPRAMLLFRDCPAEIIPVPVNYMSRPRGAPSGRSLDEYLPHAESLFESERALREYLGMLFYSAVPRSGTPIHGVQ
jgi:uncharacterized SAM-binding protein YcdF (DUF218 family)